VGGDELAPVFDLFDENPWVIHSLIFWGNSCKAQVVTHLALGSPTRSFSKGAPQRQINHRGSFLLLQKNYSNLELFRTENECVQRV
jgi:hypothetical protein